MTSLRGGMLDFSNSLNDSNIVAAGNTATSVVINTETNANNANGHFSVAGRGSIMTLASANAGNQSVSLTQRH
jgi:hypothetical protein